LRVGESIKFNVKIDGEPPPDVQWLFNGAPLRGDAGLNIENEDYLTRFTIAKALRKQSGKYTITATNSSGSDTVTMELKVKGKPSKPMGPLAVTEVFEDRCTLDWKPPEDDGGEPIDRVSLKTYNRGKSRLQYEIEKLDEADGRWVPIGRTKETTFKPDNLIKGHVYKFRVKAVNAEGDSEPLETEQASSDL
jgi:hypothetical protein